VKKSHNFLSNKIEANYRRNHSEENSSSINSLIFYFYFNGCKIKKLMSRVLFASYRKPTGSSSLI
jgi:hypothetical protein